MDEVELILILSVLSVLVIFLVAIIFFLCVFKRSRRHNLIHTVPIIYKKEIPPVILPPEPPVLTKPPSKREIRRINISRFLSEFRRTRGARAQKAKEATKKRIIRRIDVNNWAPGMLNRLCYVCWGAPQITERYIEEDVTDDEGDLEKGSGFLDTTGIDEANSLRKSAVKKKKKPVAKLDSKRNSSNEGKDEEMAIEDYVLPEGATLFDFHDGSKGGTLVAQRLRKRALDRKQAAERGEYDPVAANSGPPKQVIPKGFRMLESAPDLTSEALLHQRVMYLWDDSSKPKLHNLWFFGTISSVSRVEGFNFNIKYDQFETGTVFVNGIENCDLTMSGNNAYGRRWVILVPVNG